jgi:predicted dienelactone hydrolase
VSREFVFVDAGRATPPSRDFAGTSERTLETTLWLPASAPGPRPLVVYCHGFSSNRRGGTYLAEHLASHGYVVAAADFPLTRGGAPAGPDIRDIVNQPADVSFLIDSVLALDGAGALDADIDPARIGAVGLSLGGLTTTLLAFHVELRDERVRAAVSLAGPGAIFSARFFETAPVPLLMIAGTDDEIVPYEPHAPPILARAPTSALVTLRGGSHVGFAHDATWLRFVRHPDALGCESLSESLGAEDWQGDPFAALGGEEVGMLPLPEAARPCRSSELPRAMRPARQQAITTLAVRAFLDTTLADDDSRRDAESYLARDLSADFEDAEYRVARP